MANTLTIPATLLRRPSVQASTGMARTTLYRRIQSQLFTRPVDLGGGMVGWPATEVEAINQARIAGKSDDDIRALVKALEASRNKAEDGPKKPEKKAAHISNGKAGE